MSVCRPARGRPPRFSVVTIVRNEAPRLPRLVASLGEFQRRGGEVLVLDTGSDDGTPAVAAALGCRVAQARFEDRLTPLQALRINRAFALDGEGPLVRAGDRLFNFAKARALAMSLAQSDFQLAVDGADVVDIMDLDHLDAVARSRGPGVMLFETRLLGPSGWQIELRDYFHDRRRAEWRGRSHNFLAPKASAPALEPGRLSRDQLRVSHHTDLERSRGHQLAGTALEALAHRGSYRWTYFLARALAARGHLSSALDLNLRLDRPDVPPGTRSAGLCLAAYCSARLGRSRDDVDALLFRAAKRAPDRRDPVLRLALRSLDEGDLQGAVSWAEAALSIPAQVGISEPEENHRGRPHAILYWALFWMGRHDEARTHFEICRRLDPTNRAYEEHARLFGEGHRR